VSIATVSKVLNGRTDVGPATRARIETLLKEHDYVGPRRDGTRANGRPTVELVFGGKLNAYGAEIIQGIVDAAAQMSVTVAISGSPHGDQNVPQERLNAWARELAGAGRRAVIAVVNDLTSGDLSALSRAHLPLVVIDPLNMPRARVTSVGSTNFAGGLVATQHLLGLGHRRIAYVGGPLSAACNQARMHGYRAAMEADGAPVPDTYVRSGHFLYEDGVALGAEVLDLAEPPTAVFAGSDETAAGVIEAARARGLRIPEDLSVVGFDDLDFARVLAPPLTTIAVDAEDLGASAFEALSRSLGGETVPDEQVLPVSLTVRESTAPPS